MGFYHASTLVKDAQRHGLRVKPVDVTRSHWNCTLEDEAAGASLRLGLRQVRGLRQETADALVTQRAQAPFQSANDLARRVPALSAANLNMLARIGALNHIGEQSKSHRRDALWQVSNAVRAVGPLLDDLQEVDSNSPLLPMNSEERLVADFHGTGLTTGPHPLAYRRAELRDRGVKSAIELSAIADGSRVSVAGCVIARQRPGTAKGFIFLSLEDETGIANVIVTPDLYGANPFVVLNERFVLVRGILQNKEHVVHIKAQRLLPFRTTAAETQSHDFH